MGGTRSIQKFVIRNIIIAICVRVIIKLSILGFRGLNFDSEYEDKDFGFQF